MTSPELETFADPAASHGLPQGWTVGAADESDVDELTALLRRHEKRARGWASSSEDDVMVELSALGAKLRENVIVRDERRAARAWASVHDRAAGRMMLIAVVDRSLESGLADRCAALLFEWAELQAVRIGTQRGLAVQQIDTGAFEDDDRQHRWLEAAGFDKVRTWWQMNRPVTPDEAGLEPVDEDGRVIRPVRRVGSGMPDEEDLRAVHDVLEQAFADHFNSHEESFDEFVFRLREDPGHRWDHWWLAEVTDESGDLQPAGALVGTVSEGGDGEPDGSYVAYIGVLENARGRGVAKALLNTIIADAASRGRDRVGLEVDADSPTGADGLYTSMGWATKYITESWHKDVPVEG